MSANESGLDAETAIPPLFGRGLVRKLTQELGPLLVFLAGYIGWGIFVATGLFIIATLMSVAASSLIDRKLPVLPLVSAVGVALFGGLTLLARDPVYILIRPAVVNLLYAVIFIGSLWTGKSLLERAFSPEIRLTSKGWRTITLRVGAFMVFLAAINEVTWRYFGIDVWVWFKVFGVIPMNIAFGAAQLPLIRRERRRLESGAL